MGYFINTEFGYYEGDRQGVDMEVPKRPSENHDWLDGKWLLNPEKVAEQLKVKLDEIERAEIMPRKTREIQIQLMEFLASQQGITPEQLALNPAYSGMKEVDAQCAALRQQIRDLEP